MCWHSECASILSPFSSATYCSRRRDAYINIRLRDKIKTDAGTRFDPRGSRVHFPASERRGGEQSLPKPSLSNCQVSIPDITSALTGPDRRLYSCSYSVWKPLRGPLRDWPLALCDAASVQAKDLTPADIVFDTKVTENMQVHHNAAHKWYYLEDQDPSELLVFRQADSHPADRVGMFV